jgi:hypothetical protein
MPAMADADLRARADARFERALQESGARDPRKFYRERLIDLKTNAPDGYRRALAYYEDRLIPAVADESSDPIDEWTEYGRVLAVLSTPGRTVSIDPTGRVADYARPAPRDALVLHLPEQTSRPALPVGLPAKMTPPQKANYDLLVKQAQAL